MDFASPIPWWAIVLVAAGIGGIAYFSYRRPLAPLSPAKRALLMALRALSVAAVVFFLCRPIVLMPPAAERNDIVPVLVDVSRSMRVADADGDTRIARASQLLQNELLPALSGRFTTEVYAIGESVTPVADGRLAPDARRSDLAGALNAIRERYRGRRVSGIVVLSDGGETGGDDSKGTVTGPPVFTVGIGSAQGPRDREIVGVAAGEPRLDQTSIDLHVSAVSHRFGRSPFQVRILANGRLLESRTVAPFADGSPVDEVFTVFPDPTLATVYTAEIAVDPEETIAENNTRSVLVNPTGRKRRVLALVGAPGYEYSFMARAIAGDPGLELDSIVRKGQNESGQDTFLVQAAGARAPALTAGFPSSREALYLYDGLIVANVEGDFFTRAQLAMAAEFVAQRGGGLLVLGGRSFAQRGLIGTPLEQVLPVELNDRRGGLLRSGFDADGASGAGKANVAVVTAEGETHPVMRIGSTPAETRKLWSTLPPLAASAALGGPRPGASVLAVTSAPSGALYPLIAVQRYGRGRSMVFAGEASWRWRMMTPSTDRGYEYVWRQAVRWLVTPAPDPVSAAVPESAEPGDVIQITVDVRDSAFAPAGDASVTATLSGPGGITQPLTMRREAGASGRFMVALQPEQSGLYRLRAEGRRGTKSLGQADRWFHVGGADREFAEPRLNEGVLRRLAHASGGQYIPASDASRLVTLLQSAAPQNLEPERRDLWHEPWAFALVVALLSAEWILRRRWGLR